MQKYLFAGSSCCRHRGALILLRDANVVLPQMKPTAILFKLMVLTVPLPLDLVHISSLSGLYKPL